VRTLVFSGLILLLPGVALAQSEDQAAAPSPPPSAAQAEAMERFADAQALFERGDHAGALTEMERVYELLEGSPNQYIVLYNLGRVYEELFQFDRAVQLYERFLAESPPEAANRAEAQASLRTLERLLGTIVIRTNAEGAHVWIGDAEVGTAPSELRISAGHQVLELRADGYESVRREIDVVARGRLELDVPMAPLSAYHGLDQSIFLGTSIATGVVLVAGITLGTAALVMSNDAGACVDRVGCSIDIPATRQTLRNEALAADVLYGTAGALAITSIVLAFMTDWGGHEAAPTAPSARVTPTLGGLVVSGEF